MRKRRLDAPHNPDNPLPHRPAAQRGVVGSELLYVRIQRGRTIIYFQARWCDLVAGEWLERAGASRVVSCWCLETMGNSMTPVTRAPVGGAQQLRRPVHSILDSNCILRLHNIVDLPDSVTPPPQTQEARTMREMRIRPARIEGSVSGVWGGLSKMNHYASELPVGHFWRLGCEVGTGPCRLNA